MNKGGKCIFFPQLLKVCIFFFPIDLEVTTQKKKADKGKTRFLHLHTRKQKIWRFGKGGCATLLLCNEPLTKF